MKRCPDMASLLGGAGIGVAALAALLAFAGPRPALTQAGLLQGGPWIFGHAAVYGQSFAQPIVIDGGGAIGGGPGVGLAELLVVSQAQPGQASGPLGTQHCEYDNPKTSGTYHYLCFTANDGASHGLIVFGAGGTATPYPLAFNINGTPIVPVNCSGAPSSQFAAVNGIITHC